MIDNPSSQFVTGGPLPEGSPTYIIRREDRRAQNALQKNEYVSVVGPRQTGKTSLLRRLLHLFKEQYKFAGALIDLSTINTPGLEWTEWSAQWCARLEQDLRLWLDPAVILSPPTTPIRLKDYLTSIVRGLNAPGLVIMLDEASSIPDPVRDLFYSNLRSIYNERLDLNSALAKLTFVFAGVFDPEKLVTNRDNSPFNISHLCRLKDFTLAEVNILARLLPERLGAPDLAGLGEQVYSMTGGQPYLTQCLLSLCAELWQGEGRLDVADVPGLQKDLRDIASANINHVVRISTQANENNEFLKRILAGDEIPFARSDRIIGQLELFGAISEDEHGKCCIRNSVYRSEFERQLEDRPVDAEMKERRALINSLTEALLDCPSISDRRRREDIVDELPAKIARGYGRMNIDREDVRNLVEHCLIFAEGLEDLIDVLRQHEQDSIPFRKVENLFKGLKRPS